MLALLPIGSIGGVAWAWRRRHGDAAAMVRWGAAGGAAAGCAAALLTTMLPGDWRAFGLLGAPWLGAALGAVTGVLVGLAREVWRLARRRRPRG